MTLLEQIQPDLIAAMRSKDRLTLDTLRSIKTAVDRYRVDQQKPVDTQAEIAILNKLVSQRKEAAAAFRAGGREESALKEESEQRIIEAFLPQEASEAELEAAIDEAMLDIFPLGIGEQPNKLMGAVMKQVQKYLAGKRADGKVLSTKVKARLS